MSKSPKYVFHTVNDNKLTIFVNSLFGGSKGLESSISTKELLNHSLRLSRLLGSVATLGKDSHYITHLADKVEIESVRDFCEVAGYDNTTKFSLEVGGENFPVDEAASYLKPKGVELIQVDLSMDIFLSEISEEFLCTPSYSQEKISNLEEFLVSQTTRAFRCLAHLNGRSDEILDVRFM